MTKNIVTPLVLAVILGGRRRCGGWPHLEGIALSSRASNQTSSQVDAIWEIPSPEFLIVVSLSSSSQSPTIDIARMKIPPLGWFALRCAPLQSSESSRSGLLLASIIGMIRIGPWEICKDKYRVPGHLLGRIVLSTIFIKIIFYFYYHSRIISELTLVTGS